MRRRDPQPNPEGGGDSALGATFEGAMKENGTIAMPRLMTVPELAALLRVTEAAVRSMMQRREVPGIVRIRRRIRFDAAAIGRWIIENRVP